MLLSVVTCQGLGFVSAIQKGGIDMYEIAIVQCSIC